MERLLGGQNFGQNQRSVRFQDLIITEQSYSPNVTVPWHYHENAYLSYQVKGHLEEVSKKMTFQCTPSTILYHNRQDPHYNCKLSADVQIFHIEFKPQWFKDQGIASEKIQGSFYLENPLFKSLLRRIYRETKINDSVTRMAVEGLLLQVFAEMLRPTSESCSQIPRWVLKVKEILRDETAEINLGFLSRQTNVHQVQLSQEFPKYFGTSFGEYVRNIRMEKATALLAKKSLMLTEIAFECGFADQSHFIRSFKKQFGLTPKRYRQNMA